MSKYIPGAIEYIPQVQPYQPDFNFFNQVLETKQSQYKAGYDKLSNLYGTLLESPMLRSKNVELRNKFFNQIGAEISKIAGLDLSMSQNVSAAAAVFQPLIDNDYIMKDMAYTKQAYGELERAERLRTCTDPKKCGDQYWEGGVRAVQYQMMDFANSSDDESLKFNAPKYTPFVNIPKKAMQFAKDMGFSMLTPSFTPDGRYIISTKNGAPMIPHLTDAFISAFKNDQGAIDYYKTKAYLDMKDTAFQNAEKFGSMEAAENDYLVEMSNSLFDQNSSLEFQAQSNLDRVQNTKGAVENYITQRGIDPNNPTDQKIAAGYGQSLLEEIMAAGSKEHYEETADLVKPEVIQKADKGDLQFRVTSALANNMFANDLGMAAYTYAMSTSEQTIKEDPYALSSFDHSLAMDRLKKEHDYKTDEMRQKSTYDLLLEGYKKGELDIKGRKIPRIDPSTGRSDNSSANKYDALTPGQDKGGETQIESLQDFDAESFSTTSDARMAADYELMKDLHNRLTHIANSKVGDRVKFSDSGQAIVLDAKTIKAAKDRLESIYGKRQVEEMTVENRDASWLDRTSDYIGSRLGLWRDEDVWVREKEIKGGILNDDGSLPTALEIQANQDWHNKDSKYNWFSVNQRLMDFATKDPLGIALVGANTTTKEAVRKSKIANNAYFKGLDDQRWNNNGVHVTVSGNKSVMTSIMDDVGVSNPFFTRSFVGQNYVKDGNVMDRNQFISKYVAEYKQKYTNGLMIDLGANREIRTTDPEAFLRSEAGDVYDKYAETFRLTYNQSEDVPLTFADQRLLNEGYTLSGKKGGYIESNPIKIEGGDSAAWGDLIARDTRDIIGRFNKLKNDPDANILVIGVDGLQLDADAMEDYEGVQNPNAVSIINTMYSDLMSGNTDDNRSRWNLTVHPIIGGQRGRVAYTFQLDPRMIATNQGSDTTPGLLRGTADTPAPTTFTIVMNEKDVKDLDVTRRQERGPYSLMWNGVDPITIDDYSETGGYMKMSPSPYGDGGILTTGALNVYDDNMKLQEMTFSELTGPEVTPDSLVSKWGASIIRNSEYISYIQEQLKQQGNPIKDPSQLRPN